jgi:tetratricopeptide (TPR) repeat protein
MTWQPVALLGAALVAPGALLYAAAVDPVIADLYARGLRGDEQAVIDCISALEAKLAAQPNNQLARVYLGSAWTLRSRDLPIGPGKLSAVRKGIALMDEAAAAAPNDADVLLLRAVTNEALPGFLGRRKVAHAQLDELLALMEKGSAKLKPADQQLLYLNAGEAAERAGDKERARELWRRGAALNADAKLTQEIAAALVDKTGK